MQQTKADVPSFEARVRGLLHGVAFGDAIGAPVERLTAAEIRQRYRRVETLDTPWHRAGPDGKGPMGRTRSNGICTDDTLMTLALMRVYGRLGRHIDAWDMATELVREVAWTPMYIAELQREAMLVERLFYPDKAIYLRLQLAACDPRQGGLGNMVNCGAAMYSSPIGVANACDPRAAYDEAVAFALGHQQSYGVEAAGVMAAAVAAAFVPGTSVATIVDEVLALAKDGTRDAIEEVAELATDLRGRGAAYDVVVAGFHAVISKYSTVGDDLVHTSEKAGRPTNNYQPSRLGSIEELPLALGFCLVNDGAFRPAVLDGINSGRDTDSIGSMVGAILGAMHGEGVILDAERRQIDQVNHFDLNDAAEEFAAAVRNILAADESAARRRATDRHNLLTAGVPSALTAAAQ